MASPARDSTLAAGAGQRGFMLIEVVVALAIVALAFAYALPSLSESLGRIGRDHHAVAALSIAQSTLDRVGHDIALRQGEVSGRTDEGFGWTVNAFPYDGIAVPPAAGLAGFVVQVTVDWREQGRQRQVRLDTVRLARRGADS